MALTPLVTALVLCCVSLIPLARGKSLFHSAPRCAHPTPSELLSQYAKVITSGVHESFYQTPPLNHLTNGSINTRGGSPSFRRHRGDSTVRTKSLCPWVYHMRVNHSLFPSVVAQALIRNRHVCEGLEGLPEGVTCRCQPINTVIRVLKKTDDCIEGKYVYDPVWQTITVGWAAVIN